MKLVPLDLDQLQGNASLYYPWIRALHPLKPGILDDFPPSGAIAGIFTRTDVQRAYGKRRPESIRAGGRAGASRAAQRRRQRPAQSTRRELFARVCRSGAGGLGRAHAPTATTGCQRVEVHPVRRTALYIEESLFRGLSGWSSSRTRRCVADPAQRRRIFMNNLFRQGAFQGVTPRDAYFVKCDKDTTTQNDINLGIVNILVGFGRSSRRSS